jgi:hypothetical protein
MWLGLLFAIAIGFQGPPGIISVPIAAIASIFVDRLHARLNPSSTGQSYVPTPAGGLDVNDNPPPSAR